MNKEAALKNIEYFLEAPDGPRWFRQLVITSAIQGAFTPDLDKSPCSGLVVDWRIDKKARGDGVERPIMTEELPVRGNPSHFVRLSTLAKLEKGKVGIQRALPGEYPLVTLAEERSSCDEYQFDAKAAIVPLISSTGHGHASLKRLHYQEGKFGLANILCAVIPFNNELVSARFIYEYLSAYKDSLLVPKMIGTANMSLTVGKIASTPFPCVCPAAQNRVEALMTLFDELQVEKAKREERREKLVTAIFQRLSSAATSANKDHDAFKESANFCFTHLSLLTTRSEHIQKFRQAVLDLSASGRLAAQSPKDDLVSGVLENVDEERAQIATSDRRAQATPQELLQGAKKWEVPETWAWRGLADLALFIDYRGKTPSKTADGIRLITAKNIRRGFINSDPEEFVSEATYRAWMTRGLPKIGDVLFTTEAPMGNAAVVSIREKFALAQRAICFRLYGSVDPDFFVLQLLSSQFQKNLDSAATGLTAKGIKAAKLKRLPFAVPPLFEQRRIVEKVNELNSVCDRLDREITFGKTLQSSLLKSTLQKALAPTELHSRITTGK